MSAAFWTHTFEILVMVGVAFLLGLLLGYLLWAVWRERYRSAEAEVAELRRKLADCERACRAAEAARASAMPAVPEPVVPDDLKIIEGIGPKIEALCNGIGIYTWRQLANTPAQRLQAMLDGAGPNFRVNDPSTWAGQAALAADGKWDELRTYQDYLIAGRDPGKS